MAKTKKHRSPSYPAIDLEAAIKLARRIYPAAKHALGADVIATEWDYKSANSASPFVAALKHFGLLIEENGGADRMLRFSELALDIMVDKECESEECKVAIKKAALHPALHQQLWERWGPEHPPDNEIRRYLERERSFNPKYVARFIEEYKATISFAGLSESDTIEDTEDNKNEPRRTGDNFREPKTKLATGPKMRELPVTLPSLAIAVVKVPERMSEMDFSTLVNTINAWKQALVEQKAEDNTQTAGQDE